MVHPLALERRMDVAVTPEQLGGKDRVDCLGFLEAEDVGLLLGDQALDEAEARAHRIDVPRGDFQPLAHVPPLNPSRPRSKRPPLRGRGARADRALSRKGFREPG